MFISYNRCNFPQFPAKSCDKDKADLEGAILNDTQTKAAASKFHPTATVNQTIVAAPSSIFQQKKQQL